MNPPAAAIDASSQSHATRQRAPLYRWIFPALGVVSLLASCVIVTLRGQLLSDEIYTWIEIGDPSFAHLFHALPRLGGGGMPLFYLIMWPWAHLFGRGTLSLRLCTCIAACAAFLILLATLRRRFAPPVAFLGAAFGFFSSLMVVGESHQARTYGLYLLLAVLAVAQWLSIAENPKPRPRDLALLALSQAGLVLGHVLALFYAVLMLCALVVSDACQRRFRLRAYVCFAAAWLALIPWIPAILTSMAAGRPYGWLPMPGSGSLLAALSCWIFTGLYWPSTQHHLLLFGFSWLCGFACAAILVVSALRRVTVVSPPRRALLLLALALVLAPELFFLVSHLAQPILLPRYLIPTAIGVALLAASWFEDLGLAGGRVAAALSIVFLLLPVASVLLATPVRFNAAPIDQLAAGRPVVCDDFHDFVDMVRYSAWPDSPQYPLDWPVALRAERAAPSDYHLLVNYRREGFLVPNVRDVSEILSRPSFLLLDNSQSPWFRLEIASNPRFTFTVVRQLDATRRLIQVSRRP